MIYKPLNLYKISSPRQNIQLDKGWFLRNPVLRWEPDI